MGISEALQLTAFGSAKATRPLLTLEMPVNCSKNGRDLDEDLNLSGFAIDAAAFGDLVNGSLLHH